MNYYIKYRLPIFNSPLIIIEIHRFFLIFLGTCFLWIFLLKFYLNIISYLLIELYFYFLEWWILLNDGGNRQSNAVSDRDGVKGATTSIVIITTLVIVLVIVITLVLLWRRWSRRFSSTTESKIAANLIATNNHTECDEKANKKYSLQQLQQQQQQRNIYPNLTSGNIHKDDCPMTRADAAPDIMIQQNYGKQCMVLITNHGIPGPESCV